MIREKEKDIAALQKLLFDLKWDSYPSISKSAEKSIEERGEDVRRAIRKNPEEFMECLKRWDYEGDRSYINDVIALKRKNRSSFYGLKADHPDKPCRAMREGTPPLCGDLPGMAPEGKCYFDHQKDCNAWCSCWEGDEDNDGVRNIREIQKNIRNSGLPKYKCEVKEEGDSPTADNEAEVIDKAITTIMGDVLDDVFMVLREIQENPDIVDVIEAVQKYLKELKSYLVKET